MTLRIYLNNALSYLNLHISRYSQSLGYAFCGLQQKKIYTIIDVGTNRGQFAVKCRNAFPDAHLHCFEPLQQMIDIAKQRLGTKRTTFYPFALSNISGDVPFLIHGDHLSSSSLFQTTQLANKLFPQTCKQHEVVVHAITLDKAVVDFRIAVQSESLLKIDAQGAEMHILQGAKETLGLIDHILLEINLSPIYEGQPTFSAIHALLSENGFAFAGIFDQVLEPNGSVAYIDALFSKAPQHASKQ